jgi:hypothetical protein
LSPATHPVAPVALASTWRRHDLDEEELGEPREHGEPAGARRVAVREREAEGLFHQACGRRAAQVRAHQRRQRVHERIAERPLQRRERGHDARARPAPAVSDGNELAGDRRLHERGERDLGRLRVGEEAMRGAADEEERIAGGKRDGFVARHLQEAAAGEHEVAAPRADSASGRKPRIIEAVGLTAMRQGEPRSALSTAAPRRRQTLSTSDRASISGWCHAAFSEMRGLRVGFLGQLRVHDLAFGVGEERRAAILAILRRERSGELLHFGDAALGELLQHLVDGTGSRVLVFAPIERPDDAVRDLVLCGPAEGRRGTRRRAPRRIRDDGLQLAALAVERVLEGRRRGGGMPKGRTRRSDSRQFT